MVPLESDLPLLDPKKIWSAATFVHWASRPQKSCQNNGLIQKMHYSFALFTPRKRCNLPHSKRLLVWFQVPSTKYPLRLKYLFTNFDRVNQLFHLAELACHHRMPDALVAIIQPFQKQKPKFLQKYLGLMQAKCMHVVRASFSVAITIDIAPFEVNVPLLLPGLSITTLLRVPTQLQLRACQAQRSDLTGSVSISSKLHGACRLGFSY